MICPDTVFVRAGLGRKNVELVGDTHTHTHTHTRASGPNSRAHRFVSLWFFCMQLQNITNDGSGGQKLQKNERGNREGAK